jgi:hypothetical protein
MVAKFFLTDIDEMRNLAVDFTNIIYFVSINKLFGLVVSEEKIFKVSVNNKKILMGAMFI